MFLRSLTCVGGPLHGQRVKVPDLNRTITAVAEDAPIFADHDGNPSAGSPLPTVTYSVLGFRRDERDEIRHYLVLDTLSDEEALRLRDDAVMKWGASL